MSDLRIELDPSSVAALFRKLGTAAAIETLRPPMTRGLALLHDDLATYPPQTRKQQPAKTRKQQIKQIMLAKEGKIPYVRTGDLGRSWTTGDIQESAEGLEGTIGNAVQSRVDGKRYGPLVEGDASEQSGYHADNWPRVDLVMERHEQAIINDFLNTIDEALGR